MAQLESLPNELLLDLFNLLNTVYLVRAFFGLNTRFNQLIHLHFQVNQFSFQSISKEDFDIICRQHLPLFVDKIILLRLSNEETPHLAELILSQGFTLDRFIHLQSLSLHYIKSVSTLAKITFQCQYLPHLTHLEITNGECGETQIRIFKLFDNILNMPNLTHCNLNGIQKELTVPSQISSISLCIKYLSIKNIRCDLQFLSSLFKCTPNLQHLCSTIRSHSSTEYLEYAMPSMIALEVSLSIVQNSMKNMFEKMPNLNHLTVELPRMYLNGNEWEQIIINYLPKIKVFRLKMIFELFSDAKKEEQIDQILDTFRSAFWVEKHQWFVRCRWNPRDHRKLLTLYTLPYAFNTLHYFDEYCSQSTCLNKEDYRLYNHVRSIYQHRIINIDSLEGLNLFDTYFPNIRHLSVVNPIDSNFLLSGQSLDTLTSLEVFLSPDSGYDQFQALVDQTHNLYSLKVKSNNKLHPALFHLTSKSIHRLDLRKYSLNGSDYFNNEDCRKLIVSPLGLQCEVLSILVNNRNNVLDLIEKLSNLRLLIFGCNDDKNFRQNCSSTNDELIQWLKNHFSSTYLIIRDQGCPSYVQLWINRQKQISNSNILISKDQHKLFDLLESKFTFFFRKSSFYKQNTLK